MQTATIAEKPRKQAISGRFWAGRTYRGRFKDDHKIDYAYGSGGLLTHLDIKMAASVLESMTFVYHCAPVTLEIAVTKS